MLRWFPIIQKSVGLCTVLPPQKEREIDFEIIAINVLIDFQL